MKKFISVLMCLLVLCCGTFIFVGCDKNENKVIDLSTLSEGDEIPVYPDCEFNYKIKEDGKEYICHISSITAKFVKANKIEENDTIEGYFYPYEISFSVKGYIDKSFANTTIEVAIATDQSDFLIKCNIKEDGTFCDSQIFNHRNSFLSGLRFYLIFTN